MEFAKEQENEEDDVGSLSTTFQWQRLPQDGRASVNHSDSIVYQLWASPFSPLSPPTISVCLTPDSWCPSTRCHCYEGLQINGVGTGTNSTNMTALFTSPDDTCSFLSLCWDLKNLWDWEIFEFPPLIYSTYLSYLLAFVNRFIPRSLVSWAYLPAAGWCHACWINQQVEKQCNGGVSLNHLFTSTLKKVLSVFVARDLKRICSCMYFVLGNLMHVHVVHKHSVMALPRHTSMLSLCFSTPPWGMRSVHCLCCISGALGLLFQHQHTLQVLRHSAVQRLMPDQ